MENNAGSNDNGSSVDSSVESNENVDVQASQEQQVISPKLTKKLKLKVDGNEFDEELPFEVDENNKEHVDFLKRHLQMSKAASKRMAETSKIRKEAEQFLQMLQNDPMSVLSNERIMGEKRFREIAENYLAKQLEEQMLSPEEKHQRDMQERLRKYEEAEKKQKEESEAAEMQKLQDHYAQQIEKTITTALESSNLPKNTFTVARMASLLKKNLDHGLELEPSQLAQLVREDYQKELVSLIGSSNPEQILAIFGEDVALKIRKHDLAKLKNGTFQPKQSKQSQEVDQPKDEKPFLTMSEWKQSLNKRVRE